MFINNVQQTLMYRLLVFAGFSLHKVIV